MNQSPIDWDRAREGCADDEELLREVLAAFTGTWRPVFDELTQAVADEDALAVRNRAHRLRGTLLAIRAVHAARVATELEEDSRGGDLSRARTLMNELFDEVSRASNACETYLEKAA